MGNTVFETMFLFSCTICIEYASVNTYVHLINIRAFTIHAGHEGIIINIPKDLLHMTVSFIRTAGAGDSNDPRWMLRNTMC